MGSLTTVGTFLLRFDFKLMPWAKPVIVCLSLSAGQCPGPRFRGLGQWLLIWKYKSLYQVNAFFIFWGWQLMGFSAFMYIYVNITEQCAQVSLLMFPNSFQIDAPSARSYWLSAGLIWLAESIWKPPIISATLKSNSVSETKWYNNRFRKVSFWR